MIGIRDILSISPPRRFWLAAVLFVACLGTSPLQLQAGCGDYVMVTGTANPDADHSAHAAHRPLSPGMPVCHGPNCRQRREAPASPLNRITLDEHSWGCVLVLTEPEAPRVQFFARSPHVVVAICVSRGIFRPPRPTADV